MSSKKKSIKHEYQQTLMLNNFNVLRRYTTIIVILGTMWFFYEIYLFSTNQVKMEKVTMVAGFLMLQIVILAMLCCLIPKGYYRTFDILYSCLVSVGFALNMKYNLDIINTRELNPDKTLPYILAVIHVFALTVCI